MGAWAPTDLPYRKQIERAKMKRLDLLRNLISMSCFALSSSCLAMEPEAAIRERLVDGSSFASNHRLLRGDGWIIISDSDRCLAGNVQESPHIYVRESDPSYLLMLYYSDECTLVRVTVRRRENNEL